MNGLIIENYDGDSSLPLSFFLSLPRSKFVIKEEMNGLNIDGIIRVCVYITDAFLVSHASPSSNHQEGIQLFAKTVNLILSKIVRKEGLDF